MYFQHWIFAGQLRQVYIIILELKKSRFDAKIFGVFEHDVLIENHSLTRGFTDSFLAPHSRHTKIEEEKLSTVPELDVLARSEDVGTLLLATKDLRKIFITGHIEL